MKLTQPVVVLVMAFGVLVLASCGRDDSTALKASTDATTAEPQVIRCASGATDFTVEPSSEPARITAAQAMQGMTADSVKDAPKSARLVRVTIPGTMSNPEPDESAMYSENSTGNPGRSVDRLAWEVTIQMPAGTMFPYQGAVGAPEVTEDPDTCTVEQTIAFVDALTGWPIASFVLT